MTTAAAPGPDDAASMRERYERAAAALPTTVLPRTPGNAVEGYWIDDHRYFYLAEHLDGLSGRIVETPSIIDALTGVGRALIPPSTLARLLSEEREPPVGPPELAKVQYDMPEPGLLAVGFEGRWRLMDLASERVVKTEAEAPTPELYSPDGESACFLEDHDLWLRNRHTGSIRPLTLDGARHDAYAQQPEHGVSPLSSRRRPTPVGTWSRDSQWFLTHRIDERELPEAALVQNAPPGGGRPLLHTFKFATPGDPLPLLTFVAIHAPTGRMVTAFAGEMPLFSPFSMKTAWFPDARTFCFIQGDRHQRRATLIEVSLETGEARTLISETVTTGYIDLHPIIATQPNVRRLTASDAVIWPSEREGWAHLYLCKGGEGHAISQITRGAWQVRDIVHVDEARRRILFTAGGIDPEADPGLRRLCAADFDGGRFQQLLSDTGDVAVRAEPLAGLSQDRPFRPSFAAVGASPGGRHVVARRTHLVEGSRTVIADLETGREILIAATDRAAGGVDRGPRLFEALAADGVTRLHGALFSPSDFHESRVYPVIDFLYPGPQSAWQPRSFGSRTSCQAQALAELGFVVVMMDTRGVPFRSRALHQAGYGRQLEPQLSDHVAVVDQLCRRHAFLDPTRVGLLGLSGGGLAAARGLFDYPETFKAAVSIAGNHDSRHYIAGWLNIYGEPDDQEAWREQSSAAAVRKLQGDLFLITGDMDDNVHPSQTLGLVDALIGANKDFDLLIAPNEGHLVLLTSGYVQRRVWDFLVRKLMGAEPPKEFELKFDPVDLASTGKATLRESMWS
jgi:dipeptidyl aminopeptidase/acylaminoacyl peptidase